MDIIHGVNKSALQPRFVAPTLVERLRVLPAVVVTGARQAGKSTLARDTGNELEWLAPGVLAAPWWRVV